MPRDSRPVADINVTPLIDVMLVLLILFMMVVPVSRRGLDAALPPPASGGEPAPPPSPLVVTVDATALSLEGAPVLTVADLERRLRDGLAIRSEKTVFVRAGGAVPYARVVEVVDRARGAGAERIGLVPDARD